MIHIIHTKHSSRFLKPTPFEMDCIFQHLVQYIHNGFLALTGPLFHFPPSTLSPCSGQQIIIQLTGSECARLPDVHLIAEPTQFESSQGLQKELYRSHFAVPCGGRWGTIIRQPPCFREADSFRRAKLLGAAPKRQNLPTHSE